MPNGFKAKPRASHDDITGIFSGKRYTLLYAFMANAAFLAGAYLAISPWLVGFNNIRALTVSNVGAGITYCVVTLCIILAWDSAGLIFPSACIVAIWTLVSPWVVANHSTSTALLVNNVTIGALTLYYSFSLPYYRLAIALRREREIENREHGHEISR
jgi:hypothetical protein